MLETVLQQDYFTMNILYCDVFKAFYYIKTFKSLFYFKNINKLSIIIFN